MSSSQGLSSTEIERKANDLIQLMLLKECGKIPVKRMDINKYVLKEQKNVFNKVMERASTKMREVFGLDIITVGEGSKKCFMLQNLFKGELLDVLPEQENPKYNLLMIILSLIFMSGNVLSNLQLWKSLAQLGIDQVVLHPIFGDVKKLIFTEYVRQNYLDIAKRPNTDPPQYDIKWGLRAQIETSKMKVLQFVSDIYEKPDISVWRTQHEDALKEAKNRE